MVVQCSSDDLTVVYAVFCRELLVTVHLKFGMYAGEYT